MGFRLSGNWKAGDLSVTGTEEMTMDRPIDVYRKTPCAATAFCEECKGPERTGNSWGITEKSFPKGRIKIVLINEDPGS